MTTNTTLYKSNLFRAALCTVVVLAFVGVFNYRTAAHTTELQQEIVSAEAVRQRQKILFPVYAEFTKTIRTRSSTLPLPEPTTLSHEHIANVQPDITALARSCNLSAQAVNCDPLSLSDETGRMAVDLTVTGTLGDFREFYIELGALPYLRHIERMRVSEAPGTTRYQLKAWVAVDNG